MSSCVEQIVFFQKKLNKYARLNEADKVLYYIHKLNHLNVTVSHLEETGVGKTVNALRHQAGKVGERARCLVNKWKEMVTAEEEEEEEENEEEVQERVEPPSDSRGWEAEEKDERDDEEEDNCLHIEENDNLDEDDDFEDEAPPPPVSSPPPPAAANPYPAYDYYQPGTLDSDEEEDGEYNPLTSKSDYQRNLDPPAAEYHPTSEILTPRDSSPEYALPSPPEPSSAKGHKGHSRDKEKRSKEKRHKDRDRSGSRERERERERKDRGHRDKHKEREERSERKEERRDEAEGEEQRKSKSRKDKHQHERSKHKQSDGSLANGLHQDSNRRDKETSRADRGERAETTSQETKKDRHKDASKKDKQKRDHKDHRGREASPGRHRKEKRSKHHRPEEEEAGNDDARVEKEGKGKHREEKRKHKDSTSKKDRQKKEEEEEEEEGEEEEEAERSRDSRKKEKKKNSAKMDADEMGFGAALMGLDSAVKKKKKKKKKTEERGESCSEDGGKPSTSKGFKRGLTGEGGGLPDSKKPKLLSASKDRLPSLPSVMDEKPLLPEITPHYKPLPRPPVREELPDSGLSRMTEEEALNFMLKSKCNRRSKVYSGKVSGLSYVPSLYESCIRVLQENIDALEYTGGVPFEILRPVLERASPKQLLNLEDYNAYLLEDSGVLWEVHCRRDFKKERLEEMETWREMWLRCSEERDRKLRNLTHNLTEKFLTKAEPKRTTKIAYVDTPAKVPRGVARAQAKYGTATASALAAKPGKANEIAARKNAMQNVQNAERAANPRPTAAKKKKVAPLMAKTRQFFKKAFRR